MSVMGDDGDSFCLKKLSMFALTFNTWHLEGATSYRLCPHRHGFQEVRDGDAGRHEWRGTEVQVPRVVTPSDEFMSSSSQRDGHGWCGVVSSEHSKCVQGPEGGNGKLDCPLS